MTHQPPPFYESDEAVAQYLLFHYGTPEQICPLVPEARSACGFPAACVNHTLRFTRFSRKFRALDLGCAVGRSTFELGRYFNEVIGLDFSTRFIAAAHEMRQKRFITARVPREGSLTDEMRFELPTGLRPGSVHFGWGDACDLNPDLGIFEFVLMANLIDRLPDPDRCLDRLPGLIRYGGWLAIISPYTWLEEYTPRDKWLVDEKRGTFGALEDRLTTHFILHQKLDIPFVLREHRRKYQLSVAEATIWQRR